MPATEPTTANATTMPDIQVRKLATQYPTLLGVDHPVYCLPGEAIKSLEKPLAHRPPLLEKSDRSFELEFSGLCKRMNAIGLWKDLPVRYACLQHRQIQTAPSQRRNRREAEVQSEVRGPDTARATEIQLRIKGYAGWLVTDKGFLAARDQLAKSWNALPTGDRPSFPLERTHGLPEPAGAAGAAAEVARFRGEANEFLDHWGLIRMVTWDLPEPQIPTIPASLRNDAAAIPRHGLHIVLPLHYPLIGSDELLSGIQRMQASLATQYGLDASIAGLPHHEVLGQMLETEHIEQTIRTRYASRVRRADFAQAVEHAVADAVGLSVDHVRRLRRAIRACKCGKRETAFLLRSRTRRHDR